MTESTRRIYAYAVHVYTASGVLLHFLAVMLLCLPKPSAVPVFICLLLAVLVDATDGPLARRFRVDLYAADISGRRLDDIVDFVGYTFVPMLLIWRMEWLPQPAVFTLVPIAVALLTSVLGFANTAAKEDEAGFFRGFPSYWNIFAFYSGPLHLYFGPWWLAVGMLGLSALTLAPVRLLYPNRCPELWRRSLLWGAAIWTLLLVLMLWWYPRVPGWLLAVSLLYPAYYLVLSCYLAAQSTTQNTANTPHESDSLL